MNNFWGFTLCLVAGASVGVSMWPLKWVRAWKWENFWLLYSIFSLIIVPFGIAFLMLPHLAQAYASLPSRELLYPFFWGLLWGISQLGAGLCVHRLGLAVAGAVLNGTTAAIGTIAPLLALHREAALESTGVLIFAGVLLMLAGAGLCGWSGYLREAEARERDHSAGFGKQETAMRQASFTKSAYLLNLGIAIGAGLLASVLNISLAYEGVILKAARDHGAQAQWAPFAFWPVALLGGSVANILYSIYLIQKNQTWGLFKNVSLQEVWYAGFAACLWMAGIALYSSGTTFLGVLGISIGFAVFMIVMIVAGQFAGLMTGEWARMTPKTYRSFAVGVFMLLIAVVMIGTSRYLQQ
jgi:L-rhamnose-H+ transport protein